MTSRVRIKDIAKQLGVSPTTVSRALSGSGLVAEPTLTQIRDAAAALDYRPNISARNLRTRKSMSVLVVVRDIGNPFYLNVFKGVESVARSAGYSVLMGNTEGDPRRETEYFEMLDDGHADGMILMTGKMPADYKISEKHSQKIVVALEMIDGTDLSHVIIDNEQSAVTAVNHLIALGHKRIAHIAGPVPEGMSLRRLAGYKKAMLEAGLFIPDDFVAIGDFSYRSGEAQCEKLLALPSPPTAIFSANDEMAFGVIRSALKHGLTVPEDISVIGFDDIYLSEAFQPALTTINQPCLEIGQEAMTTLLSNLSENQQTDAQIVVQTHLVKRETTAPLADKKTAQTLWEKNI